MFPHRLQRHDIQIQLPQHEYLGIILQSFVKVTLTDDMTSAVHRA